MYSFVYMCTYASIQMYTVYRQAPMQARRRCQISQNWVTSNCEWWIWEMNLGPFQEQQMALTTGPSLQSLNFPLFTYKKVLLTGKHEGAFCFCFFFFSTVMILVDCLVKWNIYSTI